MLVQFRGIVLKDQLAIRVERNEAYTRDGK